MGTDLRAWICVTVLKTICILVITGTGLSITSSMGGAPFFELGAEWNPMKVNCKAVVFPYTGEGLSVDFGSISSQSLGPSVTISTPQLEGTVSLEGYDDLDPAKWEDVRGDAAKENVLSADDCLLVEKPYYQRKKGKRTLSVLIDGSTGQEIEVPGSCSGGKEGPHLWAGVPRGFESKKWNSGTFTSWTLQWCLVAWALLRFFEFVIQWLVFHGLNKSEEQLTKFSFDASKYIFFTWTIPILASPIINMTVSENCPQLVFTFYSTTFHYVWVGLGFALFIDFCFLLCVVCMGGQEAREEAGSSICGIFGVALEVAHKLEREQDASNDPANKKDYSLCITIAYAVPLVPLGVICLTVLYNLFILLNHTWTIIFGLKLDFALRFPGFDLSAKINAFHVFFFMLWMLDTLNYLWSRASHVRCVRMKMESGSDPAATTFGRSSG